jgi:cell wall assembly regulator SMI1
MRDIWDRIESQLKSKAVDLFDSLCEGASEAEIAWAESEMKCKLPDDFKQSHLIHDGAEGCGLLNYWDFLSLNEIVTRWKSLKQCLDRGFFDVAEGEPSCPILSDWWNRKWIPITAAGNGDYHCMDLAPADAGQVGQVLLWVHDDPARTLVAVALEDGQLELDEEGALAPRA